MYSQSILDEIRDRVSIVALIGERVPLKKAGRNFKGCCPFHAEKTPSFMVSDEKRIYHCFGCGEGGNVFSFFMKFDNMNFCEAVEMLAERAGVALPKLAKGEEKFDEVEKKKVWGFRVNELALEYYKNNLLDEKKGFGARNYLKSRSFMVETLCPPEADSGLLEKSEFSKQLFLGFAEDSWEGLVNFFKTKKVPLELAAELGLLKRREQGGGYYDFFRHRIIFPVIMPGFGKKGDKVVAFSGRTFGKPKTSEGREEPAKYLNSPDSLIYHKSYSVFGLNTALAEIRKKDFVVLVEGNLDCLRLQIEGLKNTAAPLGTALTSGHLKLISRFTKNFVVIFDGDTAGRKAAVRTLPLFLEEALVPKVVVLKEGEDPDSFVAVNGVKKLEEMIEKAGTLFEWIIDDVCARKGNDTNGKVLCVEELKPFFELLQNPVEASLYKKRLGEKLSLDEATINSALSGKKRTLQGLAFSKKKVFSVEKAMLELLLSCPETTEYINKEAGSEAFLDDAYKAIAAMIFNEYEKSGRVDVEHLASSIADSELKKEVLELSLSEDKFEEPLSVAKELVEGLKKKSTKERLDKLLREVKALDGNDERLPKYMAEIQNIAKELHKEIKL